jgi:thiosulfate/3-mercaptopyruvate sulfurtransferase
MCHADMAATYSTSLHYSLKPYNRAIELRLTKRSAVRNKVEGAMDTHCLNCHSSCGQCHVARPQTVGGGLLAAHYFKKRPPMNQVCISCHGSRIEREYFGKNEGVPPDVHRTKYFDCMKCHTGAEMHGDGTAYDHRYDVASAPRCGDCHEAIYTGDAENAVQHNIHRDLLSCQVCHSAPYKNCYSCHVGKDAEGLAYFKTEPSKMGFKIGLNPLRSERRPEKFVAVRHIPVDQGLFSYYLDGALTDFDSGPTWKMATPHTIQRNTPQNESCDSCHGNTELFLREAEVRGKYRRANQNVVVPDSMIPPKMGQ